MIGMTSWKHGTLYMQLFLVKGHYINVPATTSASSFRNLELGTPLNLVHEFPYFDVPMGLFLELRHPSFESTPRPSLPAQVSMSVGL